MSKVFVTLLLLSAVACASSSRAGDPQPSTTPASTSLKRSLVMIGGTDPQGRCVAEEAICDAWQHLDGRQCVILRKVSTALRNKTLTCGAAGREIAEGDLLTGYALPVQDKWALHFLLSDLKKAQYRSENARTAEGLAGLAHDAASLLAKLTMSQTPTAAAPVEELQKRCVGVTEASFDFAADAASAGCSAQAALWQKFSASAQPPTK